MPFYEYQCQNCQYATEVMQKITDAPLKKCPSCGRRTLVKLISAPVFRLKGSGWYETDFKSDQERKRNLAGGDVEPSKPAEKAQSAETAQSAEKSSPSPTSEPKGEPKGEPKSAPAPRAPAAERPASGARKRARPAARPGARARTGAAKPAARPKR